MAQRIIWCTAHAPRSQKVLSAGNGLLEGKRESGRETYGIIGKIGKIMQN
jgi:hypothetical protein